MRLIRTRRTVLLLQSTSHSFGHMTGPLRLAVNMRKMGLYHQSDTSSLLPNLLWAVSRAVPHAGHICHANVLRDVMGGCSARVREATFFPHSPWSRRMPQDYCDQLGIRRDLALGPYSPSFDAENYEFGKEQERVMDELP